MKRPKTICVECRFFKSVGDGPRTGIWYNLYCTHPAVTVVRVDPVIGNSFRKDSAGNEREFLISDELPYCRDINHGNCPHYEGK